MNFNVRKARTGPPNAHITDINPQLTDDKTCLMINNWLDDRMAGRRNNSAQRCLP